MRRRRARTMLAAQMRLACALFGGPWRVSVALHAALIIVMMVSFSRSPRPSVRSQPLAIALVAPSHETKIRHGAPEQAGRAAPQPAAKPDRSATAPAPPAKRRTERPVQRQAEHSASRQSKPPAARPPLPVARPHLRPAPAPSRRLAASADGIGALLRNSAPRPDPRLRADRIAAVLNKDPSLSQAPPPSETAPPAPAAPARPPGTLGAQAASFAPPPAPARHGQRSRTDERMTMSEIDAFRAQIARCWSPPIGGLGSEARMVRLRVMLNADGTLAEAPRLESTEPASPALQAAADAAIRALWQCQPYRLPVQKFAIWRDMVLNFDPRDMTRMGG